MTYQIHHDLRMTIPHYVDKSRLNKNAYYSFIEEIQTKSGLEKFIKKEWKKIEEDFKKHNQRKLRKDTGVIIEGIITFSRDARDFVNNEENWKELDLRALEFVKYLANKWNTKAVYLARHSDETTTHYHFAIMNYDYKNHRTIRANLKKKDTSLLQDEVANFFKDLGFKRGKYLAERLREDLEETNVRNWGTVASIHAKMLEEIAEMIKKELELKEKIERYSVLASKKEEKIKALQEQQMTMEEKLKKYQKTIQTYRNRIEKLQEELEELEQRRKELEEYYARLEKLKTQTEMEEKRLKQLLEDIKTIELLEDVEKSKNLLEYLRKNMIINDYLYDELSRRFGIDKINLESTRKLRRR